MTESDLFEVTMGLVAGYGHDNAVDKDPVAIVAEAWDQAAEAAFAAGGLYIPAVLKLSRTVYRQEWGCPAGGEVTVTISGVRNPVFEKDQIIWRIAVLGVVAAVRKALKQSTALVVFGKAVTEYMLPADQGDG